MRCRIAEAMKTNLPEVVIDTPILWNKISGRLFLGVDNVASLTKTS